MKSQEEQLFSLFDGIEILIQDFVHGEHVDLVLLEYPAHGFVANDVSSVGFILQVICTDMFPNTFDALWAG